ncbi:MAG: hypothetical protein R3E52_07040 [Burkholderiaceae bacterium]
MKAGGAPQAAHLRPPEPGLKTEPGAARIPAVDAHGDDGVGAHGQGVGLAAGVVPSMVTGTVMSGKPAYCG